MEKTYVATTVIDKSDYQKIANMLKEGDPFVLSPSNIREKYKIDQYRHASLNGDLKLKALLDNNIFTRVLPLAKGEELEGNAQSMNATRFACSIMSFLIMGGFDIEFNLPLYERPYGKSEGSREEDLYYFRIADNLHPQVFADVAVEKKNSFPPDALEFARHVVNENYPLTVCSGYQDPPIHWKHIYLKLLKACNIWRGAENNIARTNDYLQWVFENSLFIPAAESFVFLLFSENRMSRMIKGINSKNKEKRIHGAKNAAWDLMYITYWADKAEREQGKCIWLLCSNDKVLKKISESMLLKKGNDKDEFLTNIFVENWGAKNGIEVFKKYRSLQEKIITLGVERKNIVRALEYKIDSEILSHERTLKT